MESRGQRSEVRGRQAPMRTVSSLSFVSFRRRPESRFCRIIHTLWTPVPGFHRDRFHSTGVTNGRQSFRRFIGVGRDSANGGRGDLLAKEDGYLLITVALIGVILAMLFTVILPQMHTAQLTRAMNNLNEYRAQEAARKGVNAVRLGLEELNNFQDVIGYVVSGATPDHTFALNGNYAALFQSGASIQLYYSAAGNGVYTVSGATYFPSGVSTEITVKEAFSSGVSGGVICRSRGILWAIDQLCGTPEAPKHDEYRDQTGNTRFVSNCLGISLGGNEAGKLDVLVTRSRNGVMSNPTDGDPKNDCWYFYKSGLIGPDGRPWLSWDNWPTTPTKDYFEFNDASGHYNDFDMKETLSAGNVAANADLRAVVTDGKTYLVIGHDGSWNREYGGNQIWNHVLDFRSGGSPFQGVDNDGDGDVDNDDKVEVFVIVRSKGITAAPGPNYSTDKRSLVLIADAPGSHLPNPMPQMLEAAFYLSGE